MPEHSGTLPSSNQLGLVLLVLTFLSDILWSMIRRQGAPHISYDARRTPATLLSHRRHFAPTIRRPSSLYRVHLRLLLLLVLLILSLLFLAPKRILNLPDLFSFAAAASRLILNLLLLLLYLLLELLDGTVRITSTHR